MAGRELTDDEIVELMLQKHSAANEVELDEEVGEEEEEDALRHQVKESGSVTDEDMPKFTTAQLGEIMAYEHQLEALRKNLLGDVTNRSASRKATSAATKQRTTTGRRVLTLELIREACLDPRTREAESDTVTDELLDATMLRLDNLGIECGLSCLELFTNAKQLYLQHNKLTAIRGITFMENLTVLALSHNNITGLPTMDEEVVADVDEVDEGCPLTCLALLQNLQLLDLSYNAIAALPEALDDVLPCATLKVFSLEGNPIENTKEGGSVLRTKVLKSMQSLLTYNSRDVTNAERDAVGAPKNYSMIASGGGDGAVGGEVDAQRTEQVLLDNARREFDTAAGNDAGWGKPDEALEEEDEVVKREQQEAEYAEEYDEVDEDDEMLHGAALCDRAREAGVRHTDPEIKSGVDVPVLPIVDGVDSDFHRIQLRLIERYHEHSEKVLDMQRRHAEERTAFVTADGVAPQKEEEEASRPVSRGVQGEDAQARGPLPRPEDDMAFRELVSEQKSMRDELRVAMKHHGSAAVCRMDELWGTSDRQRDSHREGRRSRIKESGDDVRQDSAAYTRALEMIKKHTGRDDLSVFRKQRVGESAKGASS